MDLFPGSISDGGAWSRSNLGCALAEGQASLPPPNKIPDTDEICHHFLVGDEAFPLKTYLMRPYSKNQLGDAERVFNYRLSRARRVIENAFGLLAARWGILHTTMRCSPDHATVIMQAQVGPVRKFRSAPPSEMNVCLIGHVVGFDCWG